MSSEGAALPIESLQAALEIGAEQKPKRRFVTVDRVLAYVTEIPAAILVVVETIILFVGVVARYALNHPLIWSDELAAALFLWLVMFGAVIALRRAEHMRMTALVSRLPIGWQRRLTTTGILVIGIVLASLIAPAQQYAQIQTAIQSPSLHISDVYRSSALVVGFALMIVVALARAFEE